MPFILCDHLAELVPDGTSCWQKEEFEVLGECSPCDSIQSVSNDISSIAISIVSVSWRFSHLTFFFTVKSSHFLSQKWWPACHPTGYIEKVNCLKSNKNDFKR